MDLKLQDYKMMIKDIENYLEKEIKNIGSKETKKVLKDIKQIIKDWKEVN